MNCTKRTQQNFVQPPCTLYFSSLSKFKCITYARTNWYYALLSFTRYIMSCLDWISRLPFKISLRDLYFRLVHHRLWTGSCLACFIISYMLFISSSSNCPPLFLARPSCRRWPRRPRAGSERPSWCKWGAASGRIIGPSIAYKKN